MSIVLFPCEATVVCGPCPTPRPMIRVSTDCRDPVLNKLWYIEAGPDEMSGAISYTVNGTLTVSGLSFLPTTSLFCLDGTPLPGRILYIQNLPDTAIFVSMIIEGVEVLIAESTRTVGFVTGPHDAPYTCPPVVSLISHKGCDTTLSRVYVMPTASSTVTSAVITFVGGTTSTMSKLGPTASNRRVCLVPRSDDPSGQLCNYEATYTDNAWASTVAGTTPAVASIAVTDDGVTTVYSVASPSCTCRLTEGFAIVASSIMAGGPPTCPDPPALTVVGPAGLNVYGITISGVDTVVTSAKLGGSCVWTKSVDQGSQTGHLALTAYTTGTAAGPYVAYWSLRVIEVRFDLVLGGPFGAVSFSGVLRVDCGVVTVSGAVDWTINDPPNSVWCDATDTVDVVTDAFSDNGCLNPVDECSLGVRGTARFIRSYVGGSGSCAECGNRIGTSYTLSNVVLQVRLYP